ncbi:MAG: ribosome biogenesis GTPase Der [Spirochaetia bacterium]|nr:ribosome biogenesis GTPase Der [Spirochaetia bacterium]
MTSQSAGDETGALPLVAIAGRPNVGKSTLFNRLIRRRKAITDPTPGVTRDPVTGVWEHGGRRVLLVDTGGVKPDAVGLDALVAQKSMDVFSRAECIILLLDIGEICGEDEELVAALRPYSGKLFVAANKADTENRDAALGEFWNFGFSRLFAISSAHGRNCGELADAVFQSIDFSRPVGEARPSGGELTIAILGKPNTGKSTLVNRFLGEEFSIVSEVPGTTRDILEGRIAFKGKPFRLLDTAGIRRKSRVTENVEYYSVNRAIASIEDADVVLLLIDAAEGLAEQDKKIAAQIVKKGRGVILVLNKWDLMPQGRKALKDASDRLRFQFPVLDFAPVIAVSARDGWNVEALLAKAVAVNAQLGRRIETGVLNRALEGWTEENPPPRGAGRRYKLRFMTQVRVRPVRFVLFVNRKEGFPASYVGYLKNKLRGLGFQEIPIDIELRTRTPGEKPG